MHQRHAPEALAHGVERREALSLAVSNPQGLERGARRGRTASVNVQIGFPSGDADDPDNQTVCVSDPRSLHRVIDSRWDNRAGWEMQEILGIGNDRLIEPHFL